MTDLPTGLVTYLFTDIEGSSALWERQPGAMRHALARHDLLVAEHVRGHGGTVIRSRGEGDSAFAVFERPLDAVSAAVALQRALVAEPWPAETPLRVRMALHTGESELRDASYYGEPVNRCARLRAVAHGGQVVLSEATALLVRDGLPADVTLWGLGEHRLRHLTRPERIFQVLAPGLPSDFPRLNTLDAEVGAFRAGGERRELTVLFSDVRGFTAIAKTLSPSRVFGTLNEYLTAMSDVIYDFQGTLDKFMGDGILAFWGAPVHQQDHAGLACRAALRMLLELDRLNVRWAQNGQPSLTLSIGVHSGLALVGNLGSVSRFDYTVMGPTVDTGSRLEKLNRTYRTRVVVSAATLQRTSGLYARRLDTVAFDGAEEPIDVYELVGVVTGGLTEDSLPPVSREAPLGPGLSS